MSHDTTPRILHDLGAATWFGTTLAGAVALNSAASKAKDPKERTKIAAAGWQKLTPVNLVAISAYLGGSYAMASSQRDRIRNQANVGKVAQVKTGLTIAALGVTAYSRLVGSKVHKNDTAPAEGATEPNENTPDDVAAAQKQLGVLQWAIVGLVGGIVAVSAIAGEQQRTTNVLKGIAKGASPKALAKKKVGGNDVTDTLHAAITGR